MSLSIDEPAYSRLFVVAGRSTSADFLRSVFEQFGSVQFTKYLREKGVAYVKYDRASSAALAIENLHEVTLNDGQGPRLKVLLADSPHTRTLTSMQPPPTHDELPSDPDNTPPRSRLFMVVPKSADGPIIEAEMARFSGMQYCKTDLIATKGIVFVKYTKSSSACLAMETVQESGMVSGYKVKVMLAEPKTRRGGADGTNYLLGLGARSGGSGSALPHSLLAGMGMPSPYAAMSAANASLLNSLNSGLSPELMNQGLGLPDYALLQSPVGTSSASSYQTHHAAAAAAGLHGMGSMGGMRGDTPPLDHAALSAQVNLAAGFGLGGLGNGVTSFSGIGGLSGGGSGGLLGMGAGPSSSKTLSKSRLFIVVHKSVGDEALSRIFRSFPGMEYCDLKKDRLSGRSKGYCYVSYSAPEAAAAAQAQLNGIEFPPGSGCRLKVMFAEPLGARPMRGSSDSLLPADGEGGSTSSASASYLSGGGGGGGGTSDENVAAAAAAAVAAGLHHGFMASPQEVSCSNSMQMRTPMTGESTVGMMQGSSSYAVSGEPSPLGGGGGGGGGAATSSPLASPLRPGMAVLLDSSELAAVQSSLASLALQENGGHLQQHSSPSANSATISGPTTISDPTVSDGATSSWRGLSPDHHQQVAAAAEAVHAHAHAHAQAQAQAQQQHHQHQMQGAAAGVTSAMSSLQQQVAAAHQQQQQHQQQQHQQHQQQGQGHASSAPASAGVSPMKSLSLHSLQHDETVVYSALSRPLPDYALTHVFSRVAPVEYVRVLADERVAMVKYMDSEGARLAVGNLNGIEVLGEVLHVRHSPPLPLHVRMTP